VVVTGVGLLEGLLHAKARVIEIRSIENANRIVEIKIVNLSLGSNDLGKKNITCTVVATLQQNRYSRGTGKLLTSMFPFSGSLGFLKFKYCYEYTFYT
jgi:hypothetical protein